MIVRICTFTEQGEALARGIFDGWTEMIPQYRERSLRLDEWTGECFQKHLPILFIGACGIAVRAIAPFVKDKLSDSAVLVMDEKGKFLIPLLSGHLGGANELAYLISKRSGATPVITTATDVEGVFSVDVFAKKNGLMIGNREGIRDVSGRVLRGDEITITWEDAMEVPGAESGGGKLPRGLRYVPFDAPYADVRIVTKRDVPKEAQTLLLVARECVLGMGCKKGKTFAELKEFLEEKLSVDVEQICAIASIDLKAREEGLWELAQYYHMPLEFFAASRLEQVEGEFTRSEFVQKVTGADNVCERAALCLSGPEGKLVQRKTADQGMTLAVAKRRVRLVF